MASLIGREVFVRLLTVECASASTPVPIQPAAGGQSTALNWKANSDVTALHDGIARKVDAFVDR